MTGNWKMDGKNEISEKYSDGAFRICLANFANKAWLLKLGVFASKKCSIQLFGVCGIKKSSHDDQISDNDSDLYPGWFCVYVWVCELNSVSRPCSFFLFLSGGVFFVRVGWRISINIRAASCYSARPIPKKRKRRDPKRTLDPEVSFFFSTKRKSFERK